MTANITNFSAGDAYSSAGSAIAMDHYRAPASGRLDDTLADLIDME